VRFVLTDGAVYFSFIDRPLAAIGEPARILPVLKAYPVMVNEAFLTL
jgi:hypothetical protein